MFLLKENEINIRFKLQLTIIGSYYLTPPLLVNFRIIYEANPLLHIRRPYSKE